MTAGPTTPLRAARKGANLTQAELADAAGTSAHYMSLLDRGLVPPAELRGKLADALDTAEADLFPGAAAREGQEAAAKQAREDAARNAERVTTLRPFTDAPNLERVPE